MAKKKGRGLGAKESSALHIVEFSKGKPNEISLNVLGERASGEPKKQGFFARLLGTPDYAHPSNQVIGSDVSAPNTTGAQSTNQTAKRKSAGRKIKESKHSVPRESSFLGSDSRQEIARRKKERRRSRFVSVAVVVALCVGALGVGGTYLYDLYQKQLAGIDLLKSSVSQVEESDATLVAIDEYLAKPFDDNSISTAESLEAEVPSAKAKLKEALDLAQRAEDGLQSPSPDIEAAQHAIQAIQERQKLLDVASDRLDNDIKGKTAYDDLKSALAIAGESSELVAQAATLVADTTKDNVNQATELTKQAKQKLEEGQKAVEEAKELYPDAKLGDVAKYFELRLQALDHALSSNEAILIQDKSTAETHNAKYNELEAQAAELAGSFPEDLTTLVSDCYVAADEPLAKDYAQLRNEVGVHDSFLRDYLGVDGWVS